MEQLSIAGKKFCTFTLIFFIGFSLVFGTNAIAVLAQDSNFYTQDPNSGPTGPQGVEVKGSGNNTTVTAPATTGTQAGTTAGGNTAAPATQVNSDAIVGGIGSCAASLVGGVVSQATVALFKNTAPERFFEIPSRTTADVTEAGSGMGGPPSVNAVAYCIINAVIDYLTQATIDWINTGFDGNPAFVENPEQFFKDIGDIEAAGFLQQIVDKSTGIDICEPFKLQIVTGLAGSRGDQYANQSRCTLNDIKGAIAGSGVDFDYDEYTSGRSTNAGSLNALKKVSQKDENNIYGAYFMAQKELQKRLSVKENSANLDLTMGSGFLSFKKCSDDTVVNDPKTGKPKTIKGACGVTTPGKVIEEQLNNRLSSGNNRLILADKFDQAITALVNQLIKVALNQVLESSNSSSQP